MSENSVIYDESFDLTIFNFAEEIAVSKPPLRMREQYFLNPTANVIMNFNDAGISALSVKDLGAFVSKLIDDNTTSDRKHVVLVSNVEFEQILFTALIALEELEPHGNVSFSATASVDNARDCFRRLKQPGNSGSQHP